MRLDSKDHLVNEDHLDLLVLQEVMEVQDQLDLQGNQDPVGHQACLVIKDLQDEQEMQVKGEKVVLQVCLVLVESGVNLAVLEDLDLLDHSDVQETEDQLESLDL